ncbi:MAG: YkgJ family cysteine cluster protein [Desulfobacterales bacterium]|nr:YkgJ family cysteine cluster protein [Desulfobacterales bacterium]
MTPEEIFSCRMCGECCRGYGGTYVTEEEVGAIAGHIGVSQNLFVETYCRWSAQKPFLAQKEDGYCIFWKEKCTIHPVKPRMCRSWPFIRAVLIDPANWYAMAGSCPGMRTNVTQEQVIDAVTKALRSAKQ